MKRKYNSKTTIETILSASTKLFLEKGFDKTSIQDIVESAGISKGAIYHHFESKDDIIKAVTEKQAKNLESTLENLLSESNRLNGKEQLSFILDKSIENHDIHYLDDVINTQMKSSEFVLSYMQACVNKYAKFMSKIISKGINDGSITTENPEECAEVFLLLFNVWCDPAVFSCDEKKLLARLKFFQSLMASIGIDVLSDELIEKSSKLLCKLYFKENEQYE